MEDEEEVETNDRMDDDAFIFTVNIDGIDINFNTDGGMDRTIMARYNIIYLYNISISILYIYQSCGCWCW